MSRAPFGPLSGHSNPPGNRSLHPLQTGLLLFFSGLFTFVLPFICWGALAQPGHPHRIPHFVFALPDPPPSLSSYQSICSVPVGVAPTGQEGKAAPEPAGQSLPSATVMAVLLAVLLSAWRFILDLGLFARRFWQHLERPHFVPQVPSPPPRPLLWA